jgi:CPA2 family monovalent cation:H+ antiporter-2
LAWRESARIVPIRELIDTVAAALDPSTYKEIVLVLGTAAIVVPAFMRLGVSPVFGYLIAGALLGPDGLGRLGAAVPWLQAITVTDRAQIAHLAEAGIVFLLFMIGLELTIQRLLTMRRLVFGLGAAQVGLAGGLMTIAGLWFGLEPVAALIIGFSLALSSTAIVVQLLADQKRMGSATGRASFAVLLFQDIAVVPLLVLIGVLTSGIGGSLLGGLGFAAIKAAIAVAAIIGIGRYLLRPLFRMVAKTGNSEFFMAASLLVVIGTGLVTAASGLSMALGAFVAGLILAETEYRREIEATIEPFKGLLIGVFFFSVGMSLDIAVLLREPLRLLAACVGLLVLKAIVLFVLARVFGIVRHAAAESALLMAPAGEFAFVAVGLAVTGGIIADEAGKSAIAVASITMALTPLLAVAGARVASRLRPVAAGHTAATAPLPVLTDERPKVIVAGYGRVGELVVDMLEEHKVTYVAIDGNPDNVAMGRKRGRNVQFGDASRIDFLERCGLDQATVLVATMDSRLAVEAVAKAARVRRADLTIVARAKDPRHAASLYEAGVTEAVPEAVEASLHISEATLIGAGIPLGFVIASVHERRDRHRAEFQRIERGDRNAVARLRARRTAVKKAAVPEEG